MRCYNLFKTNELFQCGDTWPVGSFCLTSAEEVSSLIPQYFDIPCWPELTGLGEAEEMVGFWGEVFKLWDQNGLKSDRMTDLLRSRPGIEHWLKVYSAHPLPLLKGQMIGPVTLIWALKKQEYPVVDRRRVLQFTYEALQCQADLLGSIASNVILSLDEPCAFLDPLAQKIWKEFFEMPLDRESFGLAMHSCGAPQPEWLELPWQVVHFDIHELVTVMNGAPKAWEKAWNGFFERGHWFAAGLVNGSQLALSESSAGQALDELEQAFFDLKLEQVLLSTTCGLALQDLAGTEGKLKELEALAQKFTALRRGH